MEVEVIKPMSESSKQEDCVCGESMRRIFTMPNVIGTRDTFGIGKAFRDEKSGQTIDTWGKWEKAGYRDPMDTVKDSNVKAGIKRKIDKINNFDAGKKFSVQV
jgi:hypothetical protein